MQRDIKFLPSKNVKKRSKLVYFKYLLYLCSRLLKQYTMKKYLLAFVLTAGTLMASATDYYKISSFPIDGASVRDTFLIVVE